MDKEKRNQIGALWIKKKGDYPPYLSGKIDNKVVVIFKNNAKKTTKSPDYLVFEIADIGTKPSNDIEYTIESDAGSYE